MAKMEIKEAKVISVEKGNMNNDQAANPVMAFTVNPGNDQKIKILVKGEMAKCVYALIGNGQTIDRAVAFGSIGNKLDSYVNLSAEFREIRPSELVLHKMNKFEVVFKHTVEELI